MERKYYLPRLAPEVYRGDAVVHWNLTVFDRARGWLSEKFHGQFRELMLHAAARAYLCCPVYCLMPDHIHLMWMGLSEESDQRRAIAFLRTYLEPALETCRFQPQAYDHVLKEDERRRNAFEKVCWYILENPLRKGLVNDPREWAYSGSIVPGYPTLQPFKDGFWEIFWKVYLRQRSVRKA